MSKYKVKFKLQGLEFEIEGERDVVPNIAEGLKNQFAALVTPIDSQATKQTPQLASSSNVIDVPQTRKRANNKRTGGKVFGTHSRVAKPSI